MPWPGSSRAAAATPRFFASPPDEPRARRATDAIVLVPAYVLRAGPPRDATCEPLTPMELSVLRLMDTDLTLRQIGAELFLSVNTIKTRANALYRKLGVGSRAEALARAGALGLLEPGPEPQEAASPG